MESCQLSSMTSKGCIEYYRLDQKRRSHRDKEEKVGVRL